jgi:hypothetical protein
MGRHRAQSASRARTFGGAVVAATGMTLLAAPAVAFAEDTPHEVATPGDAVGRPGFDNPAPGVRLAQNLGDTVFNNDTQASTTVNGSPVGTAYHDAFGTRGTFSTTPDGKVIYNGDGSNGYIKGALNAPPGIVVGNALPLRECNIKVASQSGVPVGLRSC